MFAQFTVDTLIDDYGREYEVNQADTQAVKVAGIWKSAAPEWVDGYGVICDMNPIEFRPDTEGSYTEQDRYCFSVENYLINWQIRDTVDNVTYTIQSKNNYSQYDQTTVYVYRLKRLGRVDNSNAGI